MADSLRTRIREKILRQLNEDGAPDPEQDDTRQLSVENDLELLDAIGDDDPMLEELAERYLTP
ncbi:hypothetical protein [Nocardia wallacei]|uniref:Uncharacterized protein n=1 Tax=Nocardia wallacei TaxID=480035 RepID=A0A7G1KCQ5_9NOCA|nr:hypothetical protein [Nocardia wallacei]BCK52621.1 hypothetical protein NWFMUON74_03930 [Nocardia wallacei]